MQLRIRRYEGTPRLADLAPTSDCQSFTRGPGPFMNHALGLEPARLGWLAGPEEFPWRGEPNGKRFGAVAFRPVRQDPRRVTPRGVVLHILS